MLSEDRVERWMFQMIGFLLICCGTFAIDVITTLCLVPHRSEACDIPSCGRGIHQTFGGTSLSLHWQTV